MADSAKLAELYVEIGADTKSLDRGLRDAQGRLRDARGKFVREGSALGASFTRAFSGRFSAQAIGDFSAAFREILRGSAQVARGIAKGFAAPVADAAHRLAAPHLTVAREIVGVYRNAARTIAGAMVAALKDSADFYGGMARAGVRAAKSGLGAIGSRAGGGIRAAAGMALDKTGTRGIATMVAGAASGLRSALLKGLAAAAPDVSAGLRRIFGSLKGTLGALRGVLGGVASGFGQALKGAASIATSAFKAAAGAMKSGAHGAPGSSLAQGLLGGVGLGAGMAGFGALAGGIETAFGAIKSAILGASNLNETLSKVKTTFHDATNIVTAGADEMARKFGVPRREFLDAASAIGLIGKGAKLTDAQAARLGVDMAKLGADAASFYNVPVEEALEKIRAGLVGESEPLRAFGVLLNEAAVNSEALRLKLAGSKGEMTEGIKVQARASLILQGLATASGDLERTQNSLANRLREIQGRFEDLATQMGQYFLPAAEAAARVVSDLIQAVSGKLGAGSSLFASWGESLRKAAEFAGLLFRNLDRAKQYGFALLKDIGARVQEAFGWAVNEMMKFADYLAAKISHAIESALSNVLSKLGGVLGGKLGFMMGVVAQNALKPGPAPERPKFEAMPPHQDVPEFAKARGGLVLADLGREVGEQVERAFGGLMGEGAIGKDQAEKFRARARKREEEDRQREREEEGHQAATKMGQDFAAAVANRDIGIRPVGELPFGVTKDLDERRKGRGKQFELTPAERAMRDIDQQIKRLEIQAAGKGPEAEKAQDKLKDVQAIKEKQKNDLLAESQERREKAGRSFGLEEFQKEIQQSIFGGGKDPAEKTATGITDLLALLKGVVADGQLKVTGNLVANAAP